jgi:VIT1/CCC1 family predicted Fe2+/Mn2+ transporter
VTHFTTGLLLGASAAAIAYASGASPSWTAVLGVAAGLGCWLGSRYDRRH